MKWRIDRGGPTSSEIMRVAHAIGEAVDSERLQHATQKIKKTWMTAKAKPKEMERGHYEPVVPEDFERPETFRQRMEQGSVPIPQLNVPALPVYVVFIAALAHWFQVIRQGDDSAA